MRKKATHGLRQALLLVSLYLSTSAGSALAQPDAAPLRVYAAGSLRAPFTEIAKAYERHSGAPVALTFGASGLLRERIEKGEPAQVFASADTQHPDTLARAGAQWQAPVVLVRNRLCALTAPPVQATAASLLDWLLNPAVRVGTSTPQADPSGDYAWELFRKAESLRPGAYSLLDAKALKLTGGPGSPQAPAGRGTYAWLMDEGRADIFLTYCTNALAARQEVPRLAVVEAPAGLQVGAAYGLTARRGHAPAEQFAQYLLSPDAQAVLARFGFGAP